MRSSEPVTVKPVKVNLKAGFQYDEVDFVSKHLGTSAMTTGFC